MVEWKGDASRAVLLGWQGRELGCRLRAAEGVVAIGNSVHVIP